MTEKDSRAASPLEVANWARTLPRLRRNAEELRRYDFQVIEPDNLDTPPGRRNGVSSSDMQ